MLLYTLIGLAVGFAIGVTGVGGTTLTTPLVIILGIEPAIAVGTNLIYAFISKTFAAVLYGKKRSIHWQIFGLLCLGSLPASILTSFFIKRLSINTSNEMIRVSLSLIVISTAVLLFVNLKPKTIAYGIGTMRSSKNLHPLAVIIVILSGIMLGFVVTVTSVGAGVITLIILYWLFPRLKTKVLIGTNLVHAILLTAVASIAHLMMRNVNLSLLFWLLLGSFPGVYLGYTFDRHVSDLVVKRMISVVLFMVGIIIMVDNVF